MSGFKLFVKCLKVSIREKYVYVLWQNDIIAGSNPNCSPPAPLELSG